MLNRKSEFSEAHGKKKSVSFFSVIIANEVTLKKKKKKSIESKLYILKNTF